MANLAFLHFAWCQRNMEEEAIGIDKVYASMETWQWAVEWPRYVLGVVNLLE